jgi:peroxiredoxin
MVYLALVFLGFFQAPAGQGVPLVRDCSEPQAVIAVLSSSDDVQVRSSMAGGASTCYSVSATVDGKPFSGYVIGNVLPSIAEFERQRQTPIPIEVAPAPAKASEPPPERQHLPVFQDFFAKDVKGRPVSLHGLSGKVTLVCFWSPDNTESQREMLAVSRLFSQFHRAGLNAVGINLSSDRERINDALDDVGVVFPNVPNSAGLAERYHVSFAAIPKTFILNEQQEILAVGLHGKELENTVRKLLASEARTP